MMKAWCTLRQCTNTPYLRLLTKTEAVLQEETEEGTAGRDPQQEPAGPSGQKHVSSAMVEAWCKAAKANASPSAMHKLLQAYRLACHYGDSEEQVHETMKISSSAVFSKLMMFVLKEVGACSALPYQGCWCLWARLESKSLAA